MAFIPQIVAIQWGIYYPEYIFKSTIIFCNFSGVFVDYLIKMPTDEEKIGAQMGELPFVAVRHVTVDAKRHRIRIPQAISDVVPWLRKNASLQCIGFVGPFGGVHVAPVGSRAAAVYRQVKTRLKENPPTIDDIGKPVIELAAYFGAGFPLDFRFEESSTRFSIVLTKGARKMGILPATGTITLTAVNEVLQLWPKDEWMKHQNEVGRDFESLAMRLAEEDNED